MLKLNHSEHKDIFEGLYDPRLFELSSELKEVDKMLSNPELLKPFQEKFNTKRGRPTVPVTTYLRLMYLKERYQFGYETLVEEISDHIKWRKFCRIPLDKTVPEATTLIKLTQKYGPELIDSINKRLLDGLKKQKIIKGKKLRMDTTVVESNIHYPTDAGLLSDAVRKITKVVKAIKKQGMSAGIKFRNRTRTVRKTILTLCKNLRKKAQSRKEAVKEHTGTLLKITKKVIEEAGRVAGDIRESAKEDFFGGIKPLFDELKESINITEQIKEQTQKVMDNKPIGSRIVSIFDPEARPIKKGKLGVKAEFGRKVNIQETEQGIVTGYQVLDGNPIDSDVVEETVGKHIELFDQPPEELATDRGFSSKANEDYLKSIGVNHIAMPKKGKLSKERKQHQKQYWFRRLQKFRAGSEAKISLLKRKFGLKRSRLRGTKGTNIHVGWGILAHNLWQAARLS